MLKALSHVLLLLCVLSVDGCAQSDWVAAELEVFERVQAQPVSEVPATGSVYVIKVESQQEFDGLDQAITRAIALGKQDIWVKMAPGKYLFHENHLFRLDENRPEVSICIEGRDVVITADPAYEEDVALDSPWREMEQMEGLIEVVDKERKLCRIPYKNSMGADERERLTRVQVPQWFLAPEYPVSSIDETGIYFVAPELEWENGYGHKGYNVNFDYLYLGRIPRFRLYDKAGERLFRASCFLKLENCCYRRFNIKGLRFVGNGSGAALIDMEKVNAGQVCVQDCEFANIHGSVANFSATGRVVFDLNQIRNTDGNELRFVNHCPDVRITRNLFENCGQSIGNTFCVTCWEATYYIAENVFRDFGYGAIGVGVWHGFEKRWPSEGIIEHNEIYFTQDYFDQAWKYTLMDSGAIYTWTQNDRVLIRYNSIHDYTGMGDNRGIFCDDGAGNLVIYRNVVLNTPTSYSIDSRSVQASDTGFRTNENNFMAENVVDNGVRFMGNEVEDRHCRKGKNFVIVRDGVSRAVTQYAWLEQIEDDVVITDGSYEEVVQRFFKTRNN